MGSPRHPQVTGGVTRSRTQSHSESRFIQREDSGQTQPREWVRGGVWGTPDTSLSPWGPTGRMSWDSMREVPAAREAPRGPAPRASTGLVTWAPLPGRTPAPDPRGRQVTAETMLLAPTGQHSEASCHSGSGVGAPSRSPGSQRPAEGPPSTQNFPRPAVLGRLCAFSAQPFNIPYSQGLSPGAGPTLSGHG